jgi:hypothetical protein
MREDGNQACVTAIDVLEGNGELGSKTRWVLRQKYDNIQSGKAKCHNVFVYGKSINGYEQEFDGKALTPGKTYKVGIDGMGGLTANKLFTLRG